MTDGVDIDLYADVDHEFAQEENNYTSGDLYDDMLQPASRTSSVSRASSNGLTGVAHAGMQYNYQGKKVSIYVGNLTWWTTDKDLQKAIANLGVTDLIEIKFYENRANGQSKGFALVHLQSEASSRVVMEKLPQKDLHGQSPVVTPCNRQSLNQFEQQSKAQSGGAPPKPPTPTPAPAPALPQLSQPPPALPLANASVAISWPPPTLPAVTQTSILGHPPLRAGPPPPFPPPEFRKPGHLPKGLLPPVAALRGGVHPPISIPPPGIPPRTVPPPGLANVPPPSLVLPPGIPPPGLFKSSMPPRMPPPAIALQPPRGIMIPPPTSLAGVNTRIPPPLGVLPPPILAPAAVPPPISGPPVDQRRSDAYRSESRSQSPRLSETEIEEIMIRNRAVSSSAISRAVADASSGDYGGAIETLVTAISLIKQSKVAGDERAKVLIGSLQDCLHGIEEKSFGSGTGRKRDRSRDREERSRHRESKSRRRDRDRDRSRSRDRYDDREYRDRSRERDGGSGSYSRHSDRHRR
ncbi:cleavage and polyadenylation specificity factor subunit 6-like isoform X2 [Clavelina lepadiformis]|uniref:cleavage and polyadenylation specificity factor subunit 6-like isoform X2 n=1 Tax=Clavelina lepadiformis TaxID=159417 RepID=UPI004043871A